MFVSANLSMGILICTMKLAVGSCFTSLICHKCSCSLKFWKKNRMIKNWNANFSRNYLETNNDLASFPATTIWVMWAMILWTNFCLVWLRSLWLNWNIPTVLKLERYDSVIYIPSAKAVQLFNSRAFVLMITKNVNKIVAIANCSKND